MGNIFAAKPCAGSKVDSAQQMRVFFGSAIGWGRGVQHLLRSAAALAVLTVTVNATFADTSYKQCKAVSNSAEVNFDGTLIVSIYEHRPTRFCSIDVNPEPTSPSPTTIKPAIAAARDYRQLAVTKPNETDTAWDAFIPVLMRALVQKWRTNENADQLGTLENTLVGQESATLRQCVMDAAYKQASFERRTDVISCGVVEGGSFVIEALSEVIRLVLILPGPAAS